MATSKSCSAGDEAGRFPGRLLGRGVKHAFILSAVAALAGCSPTPEEKAAQDARDVALVEAAQKVQPPVQPLQPQPLAAEMLATHGLKKAGCWFLPAGRATDDPVLLADRERAVVVLDGVPAVFAGDSGSPYVSGAAHEKYTGKTHWAQLTHGAEPAGPHRWPGSLTIRDRFERIVYFSAGELECENR